MHRRGLRFRSGAGEPNPIRGSRPEVNANPGRMGRGGSFAGPSSQESISFLEGLRAGQCDCRAAFGSVDIGTAREARLPLESDGSPERAIAVGPVSTVPWLARTGGLEESSSPDLEAPLRPEAIDFAAAHQHIAQHEHLAPLLRPVLRKPSRQTRPRPVARVVPTADVSSERDHSAGRLQWVRIEVARTEFRRPTAVRAAARMSSDGAIDCLLRLAGVAARRPGGEPAARRS